MEAHLDKSKFIVYNFVKMVLKFKLILAENEIQKLNLKSCH